jgi:hypothetical protein
MPLLATIFAALLLMTRSEHLKPTTKAQAEEIAAKIIAEHSGNHDIVIIKDRTLERRFGWVFFYTTRLYAETRDRKYLLPGAAPLVVNRDATTEFLPTSIPPPRAIDLYEKRWEEKQTMMEHRRQ